MYTFTNFKSKKAVKEAVAAGEEVRIYQPNDIFGNPEGAPDYTGTSFIEGPYGIDPKTGRERPHKWYAQVDVKNGVVVKVK